MTLDETIALYKTKGDQEFRQFIRCGAGGDKITGPKDALMSLKLNPSEMALLSRSVRALSATNLPSGGTTLPTGFVRKLTEAIKFYASIISVCTLLETPNGITTPWPSVLDTGNLAETPSENTALSLSTDPVFGEISLGSCMLDSGIQPVSLQLVQDAFDGFTDRLISILGKRIGRKLNVLLTLGNGSAQPLGIVPASTQGALAGSASTVSHDDLMNLIFAVDAGYRESPSCGWVMADSTLQVISKLKDSANRPLWISNTRGTNGAHTGSLLGYPIVVNSSMAAIGPSATSVLFGDMSQYICRMAGPPQIFRYEENYMPNFQIGYCVFARYDGKLQDAGSYPIQALVHPGS